MKITCKPDQLKLCASILKPHRYPQLPLTGYLTIETAVNGGALVSSTDLQSAVQYKLDATIMEDGKVQLPINKTKGFLSSVKWGPKDFIEISDKERERSVTISDKTSGQSKVTFAQPYIKDEIPIPKTGEASIVLGKEFPIKMRWALIATAREESRPVLTGVLMEFLKNKLHLVSADGFRLITVEMEGEFPEAEIIVPRETCIIVSRYMAGDIKMGFDKTHAWFEMNRMKILSNIITGTFPKYKSVIPTAEYVWKFTTSSPLLHSRLSQFEPDSGIVRIIQDKGFVKLEMSGDGDDFEALVPAELQAQNGKAEANKIAVNKAYIAEYAAIFSEITCEMTTPSSPLVIRGDLQGVTGVVMPMFVQW